jgi:hypothetical protein
MVDCIDINDREYFYYCTSEEKVVVLDEGSWTIGCRFIIKIIRLTNKITTNKIF